ncbi:MAG: DUF1957 domain-containing protein [Anaerolineae bacterium]|nr:DUF1957 domain-containing protein [Anaerolineae bacterium]
MEQHAEHFCQLVEELLCEFHAETGRFGICASNYDAELFGHWWFEGVSWLGAVLRRLAQSKVVELTTASAYLGSHPPEEALALPEGSWGAGGTHFTWDNPDTHWMWEPVHEAERTMEALVARYPNAEGDAAFVLGQAARELLLLQASDWPFLVTTGQAAAYAVERFRAHLERFRRLADLALAGRLGPEARALAEEYFALDNVFPDLDYRIFREREERVS